MHGQPDPDGAAWVFALAVSILFLVVMVGFIVS